MALRDLVKDKHNEAEQRLFARFLIDGKLTKKQYATYLFNQYLIYSALEDIAQSKNLLIGIDHIQRAQKILHDFSELSEYDVPVCKTSLKYIEYISSPNRTSEDIMAHIYVRHFGDMFGGSMIKKVVPGSGTMYEFEDRSNLIQEVRQRLNDSMAEEANLVFELAIDLFDELVDVLNLSETN